MIKTQGNPTGHSIVFINWPSEFVYCFALDGGV